MPSEPALKYQVREYWGREPCDTRYGKSSDPHLYFQAIERKRYELEPFILDFAGFGEGRQKCVLEVGVGAGVDFRRWVEAGAVAVGIDITAEAVGLTRKNLEIRGVRRSAYSLSVADAENLPFMDDSFDIVYSWGVLHHTPNTEVAFAEVFRVLAPGGTLKAMVYHVPSWTGWLLWLRYGLLVGNPLANVKEIMFHHLESPGTKSYRSDEIHQMMARTGYEDISSSVALGPSDLLVTELSKKYRSTIYRFAQAIYPRWLVKMFGDKYGLLLLIKASKPQSIFDSKTCAA
jgi:ubiquinone/menaquinone biosynthesis C-methylase UbiE